MVVWSSVSRTLSASLQLSKVLRTPATKSVAQNGKYKPSELYFSRLMRFVLKMLVMQSNLPTKLVGPNQSVTQLILMFSALALQTREMSGHGPRLFFITPSRFQWHKFKDSLHFFVMIGVIPVAALLTFVNIFIGPAQLTAIPEGYVPKHWEYHKV